MEVISPHTEEVVGRVPDGTAVDIDRAVAAARTAFDEGEWPRMEPADRIAAVQRFSHLYAARMMDMAQVITTEMGSPITFSQLAQAPAAWMMLNNFIEVATAHQWEEERMGVLGSPVIVRSEPVGVVGAIVPWNVPQFVTMSKLAPALLSGSTIVIKPSPETPLDAFSWPSSSRRPASRRVSSASSPPAVRSSRSPSPAVPESSASASMT
ncbi:MAG: aldehyde dehydrogenase family protein [Acidimicrobiales bacterium]|nr:aldehyde dehydrogenase family protein [Acidimicrobiales bacterium]